MQAAVRHMVIYFSSNPYLYAEVHNENSLREFLQQVHLCHTQLNTFVIAGLIFESLQNVWYLHNEMDFGISFPISLLLDLFELS